MRAAVLLPKGAPPSFRVRAVDELVALVRQEWGVAPPVRVATVDDGDTVLRPLAAHRVPEAEACSPPLRRAGLERVLQPTRHKLKEVREGLHRKVVEEAHVLDRLLRHVVPLGVRFAHAVQPAPLAGRARALSQLVDEVAQTLEQREPPVGPALPVRVRQGLLPA